MGEVTLGEVVDVDRPGGCRVGDRFSRTWSLFLLAQDLGIWTISRRV